MEARIDPDAPLFARRSLHLINGSCVADLEETFSVVTYNTLSDSYLLPSPSYRYCQEKFKKRNGVGLHRHQLLFSEVKWLDADIVCLQEIDQTYFQDVLSHELSKLGYDGFFSLVKNFQGLASFFKRDVFDLVTMKEAFVKNEMQEICKESNQDALYDYVEVPTTVLLMALRHKPSEQLLLIGNVHVTYGWYGFNIKQMLECCVVTKMMNDFCEGFESLHPSLSVPHILCGDFNLEPNFPAYRVLVTSRLSKEDSQRSENTDYVKWYEDSLTYGLPPADNKISENESKVLHNLKNHFVNHLKKAKSTYPSVLGTEPFLTCQDGVDYWTLDYLWFSSDSLQPVAVLDVVEKSIIDEFGGLPNEHFSSDHLSLKAVFRFITP